MEFVGWFKSKRGTDWNYMFHDECGWIEQWHSNIVRCTGGWKTGRDTYSPVITRECIENIQKRFGFQVEDGRVIVPDMRQDEKVEHLVNQFDIEAIFSKTQDNTIRLRLQLPSGDICMVDEFASLDEAIDNLVNRDHFDKWIKKEG